MTNLYSQYYIGTGEQTKMYTLRHQYEEVIFFSTGEGISEQAVVMRDYYIQNLSINPQKAKQSAEDMGFNVALPKFTLEEIKKRNHEECEASRREAEERFLTTQKMKLDQELQYIKDGMFPYGRNEGRTLKQLHKEKGDSWAIYYMKEGRAENTTATVTLLGAYLEKMFPVLAEITFLDTSGNGEYFGKIGVRQKLVNARCVTKFGFDGFYGWVNVVKFLSESGELLMYMGGADIDCDLGEYLVMSFGIKSQEVYEGEYQTKIQRVKINEYK